jgi:23S rRNA pseudouridine1911/1915/1917 synthase
MKLEIIGETPQYIVVNKPAGINVELWEGFESIEKWVMEHVVAQKLKSEPFVGVVHRLDRAVSGVLVLAKKKSSLKHLNWQFRERMIDKRYQAILEKRPDKDEALLSNFLYTNKKMRRAEVFDVPQKEALDARLKYKFVKAVEQGFLVDIQLLTGRFHQIRAQLAHIGCPIVGDEKYGSSLFFEKDAIALHAYQLSFSDPISLEKVVFAAPKFL